jgi:hypothetical protein
VGIAVCVVGGTIGCDELARRPQLKSRCVSTSCAGFESAISTSLTVGAPFVMGVDSVSVIWGAVFVDGSAIVGLFGDVKGNRVVWRADVLFGVAGGELELEVR